jgi:glutamate formiminotransferase/glutamate formiminotransferase/formiminotetrahydrofolate cyclodeaminase
MKKIVESVPNFSEGRNPDVVAAIVAAARAVPGVLVLDQEMDHDHHRAVLTLAGEPEAVAEAVFRCAQVAAERVDLRRHQGGHPRVGATDVVPFIPIRGITMDECVALARQVGARIGRDLDIPVYLYERAATRPERTNLEAIRRGNLDGLASRLAADPLWIPDFGPPRLHPTAGATVVGARPALIAYNVNLDTGDLEIAKAIAKVVRFSSGGLPCVKAIGVPLTSRGIVQVSMNLTDFEITPIHVAFEAVSREAEQRGVRVLGSEIIGLVPQVALVKAAEGLLKVERFNPTQVLETRLDMALSQATPPASRLASEDFVQAVAAGTPTPGGGSVAALAGALAAALGVMACRISRPTASGGSTEAEGKTQAAELLAREERRLSELSEQLRRLIETDAEAFQGVLQAYRLPKTDPVRAEAIAKSLEAATGVPLETASLAGEAATILRRLASKTKPAVASDLAVGLSMALAAMEGGIANVETNVQAQKNQRLKQLALDRLSVIKRNLEELRRL